MKLKKSSFFPLSLGVHLLMLGSFDFLHFSDSTTSLKMSFSHKLSSENHERTRLNIKQASAVKKLQTRGKVSNKDKLISRVQSEAETSKVINEQDSGSNTALASYLGEVRKLILKNKHYPKIAKRLKQEGLVEVYFEIEKPNKIKALELRTASPFESLNTAALEAVRLSGESLPKFPEELGSQVIRVAQPIDFSFSTL